jgi:integrase
MRTGRKGCVSIGNNSGGIRLRWKVAGQSYSITLKGLKYDDKTHLQIAEAKAKLIESDIVFERFDPSLERYDPVLTVQRQQEAIPLKPKPIPPKPKPEAIPLIALWEEYCNYRRPLISSTTEDTHYRRVRGHLTRLNLKYRTSLGLKVREQLLENNSLKTTKFVLMELNACCSWAVRNKKIKENPFLGMASEITKYSGDDDLDCDEIAPFFPAERDAILEAFKDHKTYHRYYGFVWFLFFTGCRPSEAIALRWKHIDPEIKHITICQALVNVSSKRTLKGTKTRKIRQFPCNKVMRQFLRSIRPHQVRPEDLVFKSLTGKQINLHTFTARCWKGTKDRGVWKDGIVTALCRTGKVDRYRCLYNTRHTFISLVIEQGMPIHQVAKIVGNSPEIILKHYLGVVSDINIPPI